MFPTPRLAKCDECSERYEEYMPKSQRRYYNTHICPDCVRSFMGLVERFEAAGGGDDAPAPAQLPAS